MMNVIIRGHSTKHMLHENIFWLVCEVNMNIFIICLHFENINITSNIYIIYINITSNV